MLPSLPQNRHTLAIVLNLHPLLLPNLLLSLMTLMSLNLLTQTTLLQTKLGNMVAAKRAFPQNANPNLSPVVLMTLISCIPDQKLQSVSAPSQGVSALQPSQSPSPSMACQQQLTSLLLPLLGMSSSQVQ